MKPITPEQRAAHHGWKAGYNAGFIEGVLFAVVVLGFFGLGLWIITEAIR